MWLKIISVNGHIWSLDVTNDKYLRRRLVQFYVDVSHSGLSLYLVWFYASDVLMESHLIAS